MLFKMQKRDYKKQQLLRLGLLVVSLVLISFVSGHLYLRLDLTGDRRYTLSPVSREILSELDDIIYIRVYLDGDLPVGFRRLRNSVRELIDEFRLVSRRYIHYEFIDPAATDDAAVREDLFRQLYDRGLRPTNIEIAEKGGGRSQRIAFPGALITYKGAEIPVNFLKNNPALTAEVNLNHSIQSLEYELISSIHALHNNETKKVAFLEGHGQLDEMLVAGISEAIARYYDIYRGRIDTRDPGSLDEYDALIIAKPVRPFSEPEKYVIDQYIMKGGSVMWLIDPVAIDLDSLTYASEAIALINDINLDDQLFRYGIRLNPNLAMDLNCLLIPVNVALAGDQPRFAPAPWYFSPLLAGNESHPVTRGLNYVKAEFVSTIDTVGSDPHISREVLLRTSGNTRVVNAPMLVSLDMARKQPDRRDFNTPDQPVAVLLEGEFPSAFANRLIPAIIGMDDPGFRERGERSRMIVVADGDIIRNDVTIRQGIAEPLPLGYDRYSGQTFGNREFILNSINYLVDDAGLMQLRTREFRLRLLDRSKVRSELSFWQAVNILVPVSIVLVSGLFYNWLRRRRFSRS
jgi:ABC-2 type transport system permease protein